MLVRTLDITTVFRKLVSLTNANNFQNLFTAGRFDNTDAAVIIGNVKRQDKTEKKRTFSKAVQTQCKHGRENFQICTALLRPTLLMTDECFPFGFICLGYSDSIQLSSIRLLSQVL